MTTIVANKMWGTMASDLQLTVDGQRVKTDAKILKVGDYLLATAGDYHKCRELEDHVEEAMKGAFRQAKLRDIPRIKKAKGLLLFGQELWQYDESFFPVLDSYAALGSGSSFALGAMYANGGNVKEAIRIASLLDIYTGMGVQYEQLGE